jgi:hypothetical protein
VPNRAAPARQAVLAITCAMAIAAMTCATSTRRRAASATPAADTEDVCEHLVAWSEKRHVATRRLNPPSDV